MFPNAGLTAIYNRRVLKLLDETHESFCYWLGAAYKANEPEMAQDDAPADALRAAVRALGRRWTRKWNEAAPKLAKWFAQSAATRSDAVLRAILKDAGISVEFRMTPAMRDVAKATVYQNVQLIKSIPQQYLGKVEGIVMRGVQEGRDLGYVAKELRAQFGVTRRRAALIARDQNNKATSAFNRARQIELGIEEAIWLHSRAGKEPRPTHVANDGERYDVAKGWWDPAERKRVWPGQLINCRCTSRSIIPALTASWPQN